MEVIASLRLQSYNNKDVRFLTVKHHTIQTVGKVHDLCRKVSDEHFIVREKNKKTEGYHFHAFMIMKKEPTKQWFKKGVHMNLLKIGKRQDNVGMVLPLPGLTSSELAEAIHHEPAYALKVENDLILHSKRLFLKGSLRKLHCDKVLSYMSKDLSGEAVHFVDYLYHTRKGN